VEQTDCYLRVEVDGGLEVQFKSLIEPSGRVTVLYIPNDVSNRVSPTFFGQRLSRPIS
jgi:hypothetical protein